MRVTLAGPAACSAVPTGKSRDAKQEDAAAPPRSRWLIEFWGWLAEVRGRQRKHAVDESLRHAAVA